MVDKTCKLKTSKGELTINLYPQIPNLCKLFTRLVSQDAYSGCKFSRITDTFIQLEPPHSTLQASGEYAEESHTLIKYGKRGIVTLMPDLSVLITAGITPPPATDGGSIIGVLSTESVFIVQEISSGSVLEESPETPQFPVSILSCFHERPQHPQSIAASDTRPAQNRKRIRMFEDTEKTPLVARKFKRNPNVQETDPLFQRLKEFESSLSDM